MSAPRASTGRRAPAAGDPAVGGVPSDAAFERLASAEQGSFWFRARNRLLLWALERHFPAARSVLEVGCGTGFVLAAIAARHPHAHVAGSDLSAAGLQHARARVPRAELVRGDAAALPFRARFDVAGAFDVLEHVADDRAVLTAIHRALRPGGGLIVTVPQHRWLWSAADDFAGHARRYRRRELAAALAASGFRVRLATSFVTLLLPALMLSRAWAGLSRRPFDPGRELSLPPALDALAERAMRIEALAIRCGARLPAGGSLLMIAERS